MTAYDHNRSQLLSFDYLVVDWRSKIILYFLLMKASAMNWAYMGKVMEK
jgi:hypothetical protein